jgi:hypothetical protein
VTLATHDPSGIRRAALFVGDLLGAAAMVVGIPAAILAIGIPIVLVVRSLLWVTGQL